MKRSVLIFGSIIGVIFVINIFYSVHQCYNHPESKGNDLLGYAAMVVVFSLIYFGTRNYRNKELDGFITFGKALKTGTLIAFTGSTIYVVVWLFYYYLFVPDFLDVYISGVLNRAAESGVSEQVMAETRQSMDFIRQMYRNPFGVILITYLEIFPVGIIIALISSLLLKKKAISKI